MNIMQYVIGVEKNISVFIKTDDRINPIPIIIETIIKVMQSHYAVFAYCSLNFSIQLLFSCLF